MANTKKTIVKRKHKKRKEKLRNQRQLEIGNAKKSTMRDLHKSGQLPLIYVEKIT